MARWLAAAFYRHLQADDRHVLGDAVLATLREYGKARPFGFVPEVYLVLGDPALRIQ